MSGELEKELTMFLASELAKSHPKNHSTPFHDILDLLRGMGFVFVMPILSSLSKPCFETVGKVLEYLRQVFEVCKMIAMSHHT